jgi:phosphatidylinositol kinase/protein kinase (PI-3  family)
MFKNNTLKSAWDIRKSKKSTKDDLAKVLRETINRGDDQDLTNLNDGEGIPMSANLDYYLHDVKVEKAKVFTSANRPLLLPFKYRMRGDDKLRDDTFMMMFKTGDDMRQDKLCLQLFSIMDKVLKDVNLDLKFTLYNLIAYTTDDGLL